MTSHIDPNVEELQTAGLTPSSATQQVAKTQDKLTTSSIKPASSLGTISGPKGPTTSAVSLVSPDDLEGVSPTHGQGVFNQLCKVMTTKEATNYVQQTRAGLVKYYGGNAQKADQALVTTAKYLKANAPSLPQIGQYIQNTPNGLEEIAHYAQNHPESTFGQFQSAETTPSLTQSTETTTQTQPAWVQNVKTAVSNAILTALTQSQTEDETSSTHPSSSQKPQEPAPWVHDFEKAISDAILTGFNQSQAEDQTTTESSGSSQAPIQSIKEEPAWLKGFTGAVLAAVLTVVEEIISTGQQGTIETGTESAAAANASANATVAAAQASANAIDEQANSMQAGADATMAGAIGSFVAGALSAIAPIFQLAGAAAKAGEAGAELGTIAPPTEAPDAVEPDVAEDGDVGGGGDEEDEEEIEEASPADQSVEQQETDELEASGEEASQTTSKEQAQAQKLEGTIQKGEAGGADGDDAAKPPAEEKGPSFGQRLKGAFSNWGKLPKAQRYLAISGVINGMGGIANGCAGMASSSFQMQAAGYTRQQATYTLAGGYDQGTSTIYNFMSQSLEKASDEWMKMTSQEIQNLTTLFSNYFQQRG